MYSKKKIIRNVILVVGILLVLVLLLCSLGDITKIYEIIVSNAQVFWFLVTFGILLLYCIFYQLSLVVLVKKKYKDINTLDLFCVSGSEFFFNAITPFSSGGQPFQAYALKQKNVKLSDSTSCLLLNFLAYQVVINVFSLICLILYYSQLKAQIDNIIWLVIIGFGINFIVMLLIILIGTTKFMGKFLNKIMDLLCKIKFLNKVMSNKKEAFNTYVNEMQTAFKEIAQSKLLWLLAVLFKAIATILFNTIPFFAFRCIGIDLGIENIVYIFAITTFCLTIAIWVPTPGASGGAELAFTTFFTGLFVGDAQNTALSGMLIWRFFTYYLLIIYGLILYVIYERRNKDEDRIIY